MNIAIGVVKFIAGAITASSAMFSEGIHSVVDSGNDILVLYGVKSSKKKPDIEHPFGYGKNLYFYTFVVAVLIFAVGGGFAIYEGWESIQESLKGVHELSDPTVNYIVISIAVCLEGYSLYTAIREVNKEKGNQSVVSFIKTSKDPSNFTVLLEDTAAEIGLLFAFLGVFFTHLFEDKIFDGIASVAIGLLLIFVAIILIKEVKGLLIGEGLDAKDLSKLEDTVCSVGNVSACGQILTMYVGPNNLIVNINVAFKDANSNTVVKTIDEIEKKIYSEFPEASRVFIEAESFREAKEQDKVRDKMIEEQLNT